MFFVQVGGPARRSANFACQASIAKGKAEERAIRREASVEKAVDTKASEEKVEALEVVLVEKTLRSEAGAKGTTRREPTGTKGPALTVVQSVTKQQNADPRQHSPLTLSNKNRAKK